MKAFKYLLLERRGSALWIFLNRPELKNAFNLEMATELLEAVRWGIREKESSVLVLSGKGEAFSAGGDIKKMGETKNLKRFFLDISKGANAVVQEIRRAEKPVLGVAPGFVGGVAFGLFLATDLRIGSDRSQFNAATIRLGLVANGGASYFLPRIAGLGKAAEILFLGEILSANEALQCGILQRIVPHDQFEIEVQKIADRLATGPRAALGRLKKILNASAGSTLTAQLERERQAIAWSSTTPDFQEGMRAFLEKRRPLFNRRWD